MPNERSADSTARLLAEASYRKQLITLARSEIPFLVGGARAIEAYVGIARSTKDLDVFVLPEDMPRVLDLFAAAGYRTLVVARHWLSKVFSDDGVTDIIFNSGNGICVVDNQWFEHARPYELFGLPLKVCPPEETLWQKAFIMERDRYDGADIAHLLRVHGAALDWARLLNRFGERWPVLLSHLVLFNYIFPNERQPVPAWVFNGLLDRARLDGHGAPPGPSWCRGPLLAAREYRIDVREWGYRDPRLPPAGQLTSDEIAQWEAWLDSEPSR